MSIDERYTDPSPNNQLLISVCIGIVTVIFACVLFLPAVQGVRGHTPRSPCTNNLKMIGLALANYHEAYRSYPPPYLVDADGKPMHSWRVLILPFFDEPRLRERLEKYDFNQPWNSAHNLSIWNKHDAAHFHCPQDTGQRDQTSYVAVVGAETGWPTDASDSVMRISDGLTNTICIVEVKDSGIRWMEPRDLTMEQALKGINPGGEGLAISSKHGGGVNILFFDNSVLYITDNIPTDVLRALLTRAGGEFVNIPD